jgi:SAM-dependent methyltransferase
MFSLEFLDQLRRSEIEVISGRFPKEGRILEIGAGTGSQAAQIRKLGFEIEAIELADSNYRADRVFPITDYDGRYIPFPDASFDVVFSSNVLEHVRDLDALNAEIKRVLKPGGYCVHVLPTPAWRIWTTLSAIPNGFLRAAAVRPKLSKPASWITMLRHLGSFAGQHRHGERGNLLTEVYYFRPTWWRNHFRANGFAVRKDEPIELFYTGHMVAGPALSMEKRQKLAKYLGAACHIYELVPSRGENESPADHT